MLTEINNECKNIHKTYIESTEHALYYKVTKAAESTEHCITKSLKQS